MIRQKHCRHDPNDSIKYLPLGVEEEKENGDQSAPKQESCFQGLRKRIFPTGFCWELKGTMSISWALILTQASQILFQPVAVMAAGHLGKLELAAVSLSNMLISVLGNSIVIGFSTCLDTTFSQAFGNQNYKLIGDNLQKGLILHLLLLMPCCALYLNIEPILLALGQPAAVVELTSQYLLYFIPGFFFMFMWTVLKKFTQCQNDVAPHLVIAFIGQGVHALLQYLLLYQFKLGVVGSSIAQASAFGLICIVTLIYTMCSKAYKLCWYGWSFDCLLDWGVLITLGIYGMLMKCLEWWAIAGAVLLAGYMGQAELAAVNIPFHLNSIFFGLVRGLPKATCIRVGQFMGAGQKDAALCAARVGLTLTTAGGAVCALVYVLARSELPKMFTSDPGVIKLVSEPMPLIAIFALFDAISVNGRSVFRGVGKQKWGTVIVFVAYYLVALPIAVPLALLTPLNITGIWIGFSISSFVCATIYVVVINFGFNWETLQIEALARVHGKTCVADKHKDIESRELLAKDDPDLPVTSSEYETTCDQEDMSQETPDRQLLKAQPDTNSHPTAVSNLPDLLPRPFNQSAIEVVYTRKNLYIKRVVTITFFILLPILGLMVRLVTQTGTTTGSPAINNSTTTFINTTEISTSTFNYDR